jgi:protein SCO1/2
MRLTPLIAAALAFLIGGAAVFYTMQTGPERAGQVLGPGAKVGGPFTLITADGRTVTEKDFLGAPFLVYFGFTFCPDACPTELQQLSAVLDQMGPKAERVKVLFITIDPERDTPSVIGDYAKAFGPHIVGLTGSIEQVTAAARAYGAFFQKVPLPDSPGEYTMDHTTATYLMTPRGSLSVILVPNQSADEITSAIAKLL